jgi:rsbT antagonist protein RsbS
MSMELKRLPIIKLWDRIVVPIQGEITDELASHLSHEILRVIHQSGAHGLVLDLTGVWIMDSHLCSVLSNLAAAARLMGTPTIISGLSPEIAMTLQTMGVELEAVRTALSLEQALAMLGLDVRRAEDADERAADHDALDEDDDGEPADRGRLREDGRGRGRSGGGADALGQLAGPKRRLRFADS